MAIPGQLLYFSSILEVLALFRYKFVLITFSKLSKYQDVDLDYSIRLLSKQRTSLKQKLPVETKNKQKNECRKVDFTKSFHMQLYV